MAKLNWTAIICAAIPTLGTLGVAYMNSQQARANEKTALRNHDEVRRRHRFSMRTPPLAPSPVAEPEPARKTNLEVLSESIRVAADNAADDTVKVLVQPTTIGRFFGQQPQTIRAGTLRKQLERK